MVKFFIKWRDELRNIPVFGMQTYRMRYYDVVKATKSQLKKKGEGEWVIVDKRDREFTIQRIG